MSTEDRLRDALGAEAETIEPRDGWDTIEGRLGKPTPPNRLRYLALAAAVLVIAGAAVALGNRDANKRPVNAGPAPTTTLAPTTTTSLPEPTVRYLWPFDQTRGYPTARAAALAFAREFLGMPNPTVGAPRPSAGTINTITVHPFSDSAAGFPLDVEQFDNTGWHVIDAHSEHLEVDGALPLIVTSPLHVTGRSVAFEGTAHATLLPFGAALPEACTGHAGGCLGSATFSGGSTELAPFAFDLSFSRPQTQLGVLVLWIDSPRDGSLAEATTAIVRFS